MDMNNVPTNRSSFGTKLDELLPRRIAKMKFSDFILRARSDPDFRAEVDAIMAKAIEESE